ncbi:agmatine deiminase family protein [Helicobacter bilis]|uniref:agmatine deiminase family protein n=1 Tax=Helicobacter bilis TaxID=37372 RepID=UPI00051D860C|nr:agmatine deiminase family protein [Helicobacter bilis]TLE07386.1 agmatine deiminase family protein [Helicobacter bilis]
MFAEWEEQKGIVLIYPHIFCDFNANLEEVQECYESLITEILKVEPLFLIVHPKDNDAKTRLQDFLFTLETKAYPCKIIELESNDLWARDSIVISVKKQHSQVLTQITNAMLGSKTKTNKLGILDKIINKGTEEEHIYANFGFNGWGLKYPANLDNKLNAKLHEMGLFENMQTYGMILEGGSIDYNGNGLLLTNTQCLLEANRNPHLSKEEVEENLKSTLQVEKILWLNNGFLLGDDTDSHIDTLARFINENTIAYIKCDDLNNPHFSALNAMEHELESLAKTHNLNLVPLPFCDYVAKCDEDSIHNNSLVNNLSNDNLPANNLPASYVNFLFLNQKVLLMPTYNKPTDLTALQTLKKALPDYNVIGINCEALIQQHGSLHCVSMQIH